METGKLVWKVGDRTGQRPAGDGPAGLPGRAGPRSPRVRPPRGRRKAAAPADVKHTTETLLADCFFLGPPLPLGGKLYLVVEK